MSGKVGWAFGGNLKLRNLRIQNFRGLVDVTINLDSFTCLIGANGVGKSTVFAALNVLFRKPGRALVGLKEIDFHCRDTSKPILVTATFDALSPEAMSDLAHYVRHGQVTLKVEATWENQQVNVRQIGSRLVMPQFAAFFAKDAEGVAATDLRAEYATCRASFGELPSVRTKADMVSALRAYEERHPELCVERESRDDFYGATGAAGVLARHFVWIHVPAAKDASDEQTETKGSWFGQLVQHVARSRVNFDAQLASIRSAAASSYRELVAGQQEQLAHLSDSLTTRMRDWSHPDARLTVRWSANAEDSISISAPSAELSATDGSFDGPLASHGHGFQRSYLVSLLQEFGETTTPGTPSLLLGIEEPELYQHPPQARHLASVLEQFSTRGQVLVCTHSPYFVSGNGFTSVRLLRRTLVEGDTRTEVNQASLEQLQARMGAAGGRLSQSVEGTRIKLHQHLHPVTNEIFFAPVVVLVEGYEDLAYLTAYLHLSGRDVEFRKLGCHIVPAGMKSNIPSLLAVTLSLKIPTFVLCDADVDQCTTPAKAGLHERDNGLILKLLSYPLEPAQPATDLWRPNLVMWRNNLTSVFESELGVDVVNESRERVRDEQDLSDQNLTKSALFVGATVEELWARDRKSANLLRLCDAILAYGNSVATRTAYPVTDSRPPEQRPSTVQ